MEATRERLCGGRGQIGPTKSLYACAAVNADNGALSGRCWPAHILGAAELYAENPWPDTPEVFTATYQALGAYAWRSDSETARDVTAEPVEFIVNIGDMTTGGCRTNIVSSEALGEPAHASCIRTAMPRSPACQPAPNRQLATLPTSARRRLMRQKLWRLAPLESSRWSRCPTGMLVISEV